MQTFQRWEHTRQRIAKCCNLSLVFRLCVGQKFHNSGVFIGEIITLHALSEVRYFMEWSTVARVHVCFRTLRQRPKREKPVVKNLLSPGDVAPAFTLLDQDENAVSLADFRDSRLILYFYPAASTPGCTTQACDFRDNMVIMQGAGYTVLGISRDKPSALKRFAIDENLRFPLLSDEDLSVHNAYGTFGEKSMYGRVVTGVIRSTFVIDGTGLVEHALYGVRATGHVEKLRLLLGL